MFYPRQAVWLAVRRGGGAAAPDRRVQQGRRWRRVPHPPLPKPVGATRVTSVTPRRLVACRREREGWGRWRGKGVPPRVPHGPQRDRRGLGPPRRLGAGAPPLPPPPAIVHVDADAPWPSHVPTAAALARINLCASAFARLQEGAARGQPEPSRGTSNKRWVGSAWLCQGTRPLRRLPPRRGPHRDRKRGWVTRLGMVAAVGGPPPGTVDRYCTRPRLADWAGTFTRGQAMPARLGWSWGPSAASVVSRGAMTGLRRGAGS